MKRRSRTLVFLTTALLGTTVVAAGFLWPDRAEIPVLNATPSDWNHETFWYHPWGTSIVHKGIDIFAPKGQPVLAATDGMVLSTGFGRRGGHTIAVLGPRWRIHYYAHLESVSTQPGRWIPQGHSIGTVGNTGNAIGKPDHLHYSIVTLIPYPWRIDASRLGMLKMFFLDPGEILLNGESAGR